MNKIIVVLVFSVCLGAIYLLARDLWPNDLLKQIGLSAFASLLVTISQILLFGGNLLSSAAQNLRDFERRHHQAIEQAVATERQRADARETQLAKAQAEVDEAVAELQRASTQAAEASDEYNAQSGKERVLRFVRERVISGDYAKHLGFIAAIRKDFEQLSKLMTATEPPASESEEAKRNEWDVKNIIDQARSEELLEPDEIKKLQDTIASQNNAGPALERIILYIDDLDRCPADQVVKVLQAVHLLLTFPLFVVFVAVDIRWLREALASQYHGQLSGAADSGPRDIATPLDYLEKIFQIPYWVRRMSPENTLGILNDSMGPPPDKTVGPVADRLDTEATKPDRQEEENEEKYRPDSSRPSDEEEAVADRSQTRRLRRVAALQLTQNEREFIGALAGSLDGSPRRTLRFINTYRLIKASLSPGEIELLEADGYRALATLLAVNMGADESPSVMDRILAQNEAFEIQSPILDEAMTNRDHIGGALSLYETAGGTSADLVKYAPIVARFAFTEHREIR